MTLKALLIASLSLVLAPSAFAAADRISLELDGVGAGPLFDAEGGGAFADVIVDPPGKDGVARKRPGAVKWGNIILRAGSGMSRDFYEWLKASMDGKSDRRSGAFTSADFDYKAVSTVTFHEALVTAITMPALDADAKDNAKMTVEIKPGSAQSSSQEKKTDKLRTPQKQWLPSNFTVKIDGLEAATSQTTKVDAITVKMSSPETSPSPTPDQKFRQLEPTKLEYPNLTIYVPESAAAPFVAWHQDFIIAGNNDDSKEKNGSIDYLSRDGKPLFRLKLSHIGVLKVNPDKMDANDDRIKRVKVELYVEEMKFDFSNAATLAFVAPLKAGAKATRAIATEKKTDPRPRTF